MTGNRTLFNDVWNFARRSFVDTPEHYHELESRLSPALQLCSEGDLTPLMMVLIDDTNDCEYRFIPDDAHPMVLAARYGHLPAVKLWLSRGIRAQIALSAAVRDGQREVVDCLIAHGADPLDLSLPDQQLFQSLRA